MMKVMKPNDDLIFKRLIKNVKQPDLIDFWGSNWS